MDAWKTKNLLEASQHYHINYVAMQPDMGLVKEVKTMLGEDIST